MAGLVPAIHESAEVRVQILPNGVGRENEPYLPLSWPMFHIFLALDGRHDVRMRLRINEPLQTVSLGEPFHQALAMFPDATWEIAGHAGVERAVRAVGHDIDPSSFHTRTLRQHRSGGNTAVDGRDKPGHDGSGIRCRVRLSP